MGRNNGRHLFSNILVAIDGSESSMAAAQVAIEMAARDRAKLTAINVLHLPATGVHPFTPAGYSEIIEEQKKDAKKWFGELSKEAAEAGVELKTEIIDGAGGITPAIVGYAESRKIDLIVMGTRGKGSLKRMLLGSVAQGVITYAPCPVIVIR